MATEQPSVGPAAARPGLRRLAGLGSGAEGEQRTWDTMSRHLPSNSPPAQEEPPAEVDAASAPLAARPANPAPSPPSAGQPARFSNSLEAQHGGVVPHPDVVALGKCSMRRAGPRPGTQAGRESPGRRVRVPGGLPAPCGGAGEAAGSVRARAAGRAPSPA